MVVALVSASAYSMMTGTIGAYSIDMLAERGKLSHLQELISSGTFWAFLALGIGSLAGGYVGTFSLNYPILLCIIFALAGLLYSWFVLKDEDTKKNFTGSEKNIAATTRRALEYSKNNPSLRMTFFLSILFGIAAFALFNYWQPVMQDLGGWNTFHMGLFFFLLCIASLAGARISGYLKPNWTSVIFVYILFAVFLFLAGWVAIPLAIAAFILLFNILIGMSSPIQGTIMNRNTTSEIRATTESINAMFSRLGAVIFGILVFLIGADQPRLFWIIGAGALLLGAFIILVFRPTE
jgi:predicted MFS family arabinose efflux permease